MGLWGVGPASSWPFAFDPEEGLSDTVPAEEAELIAAAEELAAPAPIAPPSLPAGYILAPIDSLRTLYAPRDPAASGRDVRTIHPSEVGADIVVSGTFHDGRGPVGPVISGGRWLTSGVWPHGRGGVAVLANGEIRIGYYPDAREASVRAAFEQPGVPLQEFMGGGALILEGGKAVSSEDLETRQRFRGGASAPQFEATARHTLIGIHSDGRAYLIVETNSLRLADLQADLLRAGFTDVVMFDGGNAFGYEDRDRTLFGRLAGEYPPELSDAEVARLRGRRDVALTGFAIRTAPR
ncbi:MAG: hypothetical protein KatS3mg102_0395 [Planctomycetota bacterium]|nr:MAG: hypothetical protein KatS3mg102_0395 [Planctomycetota bacterium]